MSHFEFKLPDVGEGVAEGEVVTWHVQAGDLVREDQEMVEVMTDKATVSIGSPKAGRVVKLCAEPGDVVAVGTVLVVIDTAAEAHGAGPRGTDQAASQFQAPASMPPVARERARRNAERHSQRAAPAATATASGESAASAVGDIKEELPGMQWLRAQRAASEAEAGTARKPLATPSTRKLARDMGVSLAQVTPSGDGGRITARDVREHAGQPAEGERAEPAPATERVELEERQPFVGLRRRIAERMHEATTKPAAFTFVEEVQVDGLRALVERLRPSAEAEGVRLSYLPFVVKAVTLALKKHPLLNSTLDEKRNELVLRRYYHMGIATATERGLMVPVVRDTDQKSPLEIAREIRRLAEGARDGSLAAAELSGSTFTITSLGKRGGLLATPVLNHPEVGIVGVHRMREKPVVRDGAIVVGQVMMLSLSFDHRIVDGDVGAAFAYDIIAYLEEPERLLLEMR